MGDSMFENKKIGLGITGSFCSINNIFNILQKLVDGGADVYVFVSDKICSFDTRFAIAKDFIENVEKIINKKIISDIVVAEQFGPKIKLDLMIILPMTGTSLGKFANSINDNAPLLGAKATLRNNRPLLIGVMTNDGLGLNGVNIMKLLSTKNIFFIPFGQDDIINKKNSLTCNFDKVIDSIVYALKYEQIQPVIIEF